MLARVGAAEPQPGLLHGVVGLAERAEHPVGDRPQVAAVLLEALGELVLVHGCHIPPSAVSMHDPRTTADVTHRRRATMEARMPNPAIVVPGAMEALPALSASRPGTPASRRRRSSSSTCGRARSTAAACASRCAPARCQQRRRADERIFTVAAWREAPYFTDAERAALALTEAVTRLADRADPVPDEVWDEAARHYDEAGARGPRAHDRRDQRLEPAQRRDPPGRRQHHRLTTAAGRR